MEKDSIVILRNAKETNWFGNPINQFHNIFSLRKFFSNLNLVNIQLDALVQLSNESVL